MTAITIIIPTLGRPTLPRALDSALAAMGEHDEVIVVADGELSATAERLRTYHDPRIKVYSTPPTRCWGAAQYDYGMSLAAGDWVMFLPDDDYMPVHAVEAVRKAVENSNDPVHIFACHMLHWGGRVLQGSVDCCHVTANQLVVPSHNNKLHLLNAVCEEFPPPGIAPRRMPLWSDNKSQTFDHAYITALLDWYRPAKPQFHADIICIADQQNNGRLF